MSDRLFSECCALERVETITDRACHLAAGAVIRQCAFEECAELAQLSLRHVRAMMESAALATPHGSFYASGIQQVELGSHACFIGHGTCESCNLLTLVDLRH